MKINLKNFPKYFINGLLIMIPVAITIYIFYFIFVKVDSFLLRIPIPGVGLVITVVFIAGIGYITTNLLSKSVYEYMDKLFAKIPLVKILYSSFRDLIGAFVGKEKKFNKPVLVSLSKDEEIKVLGFITSNEIDFLDMKDEVTVYMPQSYNFAGNLLVVSRKRIKPLDIHSAKVMAIIASAAVTGSKSHKGSKEHEQKKGD